MYTYDGRPIKLANTNYYIFKKKAKEILLKIESDILSSFIVSFNSLI